MNYNFTELMAMLDWNNSESNQQKGREIAKTIQDLNIFLQPTSPSFNKNVWDNCAKILYEKTDDELEPYLIQLLEWLQDLNWPGALLISKRLTNYNNQTIIAKVKNRCMEQAKEAGDRIWLENMIQMLP